MPMVAMNVDLKDGVDDCYSDSLIMLSIKSDDQTIEQ